MLDEFKSAFNRYNNAPVQLIIINAVIFVIIVLVKVISHFARIDDVFELFIDQIVLPSPIQDFITRPWTLITYMFIHDHHGVLHILFNMLVLYWFGRLFVEYLGSDKLIALYILGGLVGGFLYLLVYNTVPQFQVLSNLRGASAAVDAIVVATATLLPNYTFFLLFFGPVRIKYIAAFTVLLSFIGTYGENAGGNIAHLGGALIGFIYIKQLQAGTNWGIWVTATLDWIKGLFREKPKVKVSYRKDRPAAPRSAGKGPNYTQEEIDAILDKISAGGYESLTKEEKEKLFNASKKN